MSPEHRSLNASCRCVACVACVGVWSWSALQFALQDLKIALIAMLQVCTHCLYCSPPPFYQLRPCPSCSGCRDHINLGPNLIRYKCSAANKRHGFGDKFAICMRSWTHFVEIECIPTIASTVSNCIPSSRSAYHMCIPIVSSFVVVCAQLPRPSFLCGSSPDTMQQLSLKLPIDFACILRGMASFLFLTVFMYHMRIPCVSLTPKVCIPR